jgi:nucleotide-binding universal stress UspA family protein
MVKKILLATDGSEISRRAGEYAIYAANMTSANLIVLNVIDMDYLESLPQTDLREKLDEELREEGKTAVEKFEKSLEDKQCDGTCTNVNLVTLIKKGKPEEIILQIADQENVDEIIIGKSGKHGMERLLLGSTTERVVRKSKVPVIVIP